jgi:hypothetical protein
MRRLSNWIVVAFLCLTPAGASAQWAQGGLGKLWVKSAAFWQKTDMRFDVNGDKVPWLGGVGESDARALYTDFIVGLHPRVDFWLQVPFFDLRFTDATSDLRTVGFGDIRGWVRWQYAQLGGTALAIRAGAKAPIGDSPLDAQIIPVGEGQWDLEGVAEVGHSLWPVPAYAELWLGYRKRFEDEETRKQPGDEVVFLAEAGINPTPSTFIKTTLDGFRGDNFIVEGVRTQNKREITNLQFSGAVRIGQFWPEFGVRIPLAGQEFPAGVQYVLGVSSTLR